MLFNIWLWFARIDSSRRWDIFRRCFDWQHWNISYKRPSFHHYPNPPQFLRKSCEQSHQEVFVEDMFTSGGFSYSFGGEGRGGNGALLTFITTFQELGFSTEANTRFFYLRAKAKHVAFICLEVRTRAKKKIHLWQLSVKQSMSKGSKWK